MCLFYKIFKSALFESHLLNQSKWLATLYLVMEFVTKTMDVMLFICIMFIVHFSALFNFFCLGGHGPSPLQGSMDQVQNAGSMEPMFCPHTSLPYHSFPLSQRSSSSMPVSCKVPTIKLTWTVFLKKSLFQGHPTRI